MNQPQGQCPKCNTPNLYTATNCSMCGARLPWADAVQRPAPGAPQRTPSSRAAPSSQTASPKKSFFDLGNPAAWARCLIFIGAAWVFYFLFFFDTTVAVPSTDILGVRVGGGRVHNIGLMAERQNYILVGIGVAILGAVLYFAARARSADRD